MHSSVDASLRLTALRLCLSGSGVAKLEQVSLAKQQVASQADEKDGGDGLCACCQIDNEICHVGQVGCSLRWNKEEK